VSAGRERRVRRRALKHLRTALGEAGDELSRRWVARDPDFRAFRAPELDPDWSAVAEPGAADDKPEPRVDVPELTPRKRQLALPRRPWHPAPRMVFWFLVVALAAVGLWRAFATGAHGIFVAAAALAIAVGVYRFRLAQREHRLIGLEARLERRRMQT
jgi:hypothetical protein